MIAPTTPTLPAANLLTSQLLPFGNIAWDAYQNVTSKLQKLTDDLPNKTDLAAAITTLYPSNWKTEMVAANTMFNTQYIDRLINIGLADTSEAKMYNKWLEITAAYFEVRDQIDATYIFKKKTAPWAIAIAALNGVIKDYNDLIASQSLGDEGTNIKGTTIPPTI